MSSTSTAAMWPTSTTSIPALQNLDPATLATLPLLANEQLKLSHWIQFGTAYGIAHLTDLRFIMRLPSKPIIAIPLSLVTGNQVSGEKSTQVMMKINYVLRNPSSAGASTTGATADAKKDERNAVLIFVSDTAKVDRQIWRDFLAAAANKANSAKSTPATSPSPSNQASRVTRPTRPPTTVSATHGPTKSSASVHSTTKTKPSTSLSTSANSAVPDISVLETRASLLVRHPHLKALHVELVQSGVISEEEFWSSRQELLRAEREQSVRQQLGISSAILPDNITHTASADVNNNKTSNMIHFKIDANIIHSIFLQYPAVHAAYEELVPDRMTEKEFWTKYFRSKYVHANQSKVDESESQSQRNATNEKDDEVFATTIENAAKKQEGDASAKNRDAKRAKLIISANHVDPSVDLTAADADDAVMLGQPSSLDPELTSTTQGTRPLSKKEKAYLDLIRKFNRHGRLIVEHTERYPSKKRRHSQSHLETSATEQETNRQHLYHRHLADALELTDLGTLVPPSYHELSIQQNPLEGHRNSLQIPMEVTPEEVAACSEKFLSYVDRWKSSDKLPVLPSAQESFNVLVDISNKSRGVNRAMQLSNHLRSRRSLLGDVDAIEAQLSGNIAGSTPSQTSNEIRKTVKHVVFSGGTAADFIVPPEFETSLKKHFLTSSELLRHFYACFPLTPRSTAKLERIKSALDDCYRSLLQLRAQLNASNQGALTTLLKPIETSIEKCHSAYLSYKQKEKQRLDAVKSKATPNAPVPIKKE